MRRRSWEGGEVGAMRPAFLKISKEPKKNNEELRTGASSASRDRGAKLKSGGQS